MKNNFWTLILIISFIFCMDATTHALNKPTHRLINQYIVQNSFNGFSLDSYLKSPVGIPGGILESFNKKNAWEWLRDGGQYEDEPAFLRSVNHFHNPINKEGFSGLSWLLWGGFGWLNGVSSIQWSQEPVGTQSPGGHYSWFDVRNSYYNALTAVNDADRQQNFADTFRGLGQLMHLVEDLSVPEHTRNELHGLPFTYRYENWVEKKVNNDVNSEYYIGKYTPIFFDPSVIGNTNPLVNLASVPVANLFDTNTYNGTNPSDTCDVNSQISQIGLSEYTNANFISAGTAFTSGFPYPNWNSMVQGTYSSSTNSNYLTKLGKGETAAGGKIGNGEHIEHFAKSRWGRNLLPSSISQNGISLKLDNSVYAEYASHLIPRAVGYAAGLLQYFFRGQITAWDWYDYYDGLPASYLLGIYNVKITNNTPGEAMGPGTLIVSYKYQPGGYGVGDFTYGITSEVALNEIISSGADSTTTYTFSLPVPIPLNGAAHPAQYLVIFKGKLGNEEGAVVPLITVGAPL